MTAKTYCICKIGGSLLTDKSRLRTPNGDAIGAYGRAIAALDAETRSSLILVAGGGSFGNATAHPDFLPGHPDRIAAVVPLFTEWAAILESGWRGAGLSVTVLTADKLFTVRHGALRFDAAPIRVILNCGAIPVLMGGVVWRGAAPRLVSSDVLPLFLARAFAVSRFVSLSDVPGLLVDGEVLRVIDPSISSRALLSAAPSRQPDATGGMRYKVETMLRLARLGTEGVICSGRNPSIIQAALSETPPPGTHFTVRPPAPALREPAGGISRREMMPAC